MVTAMRPPKITAPVATLVKPPEAASLAGVQMPTARP
jgi:hypothetical protein